MDTQSLIATKNEMGAVCIFILMRSVYFAILTFYYSHLASSMLSTIQSDKPVIQFLVATHQLRTTALKHELKTQIKGLKHVRQGKEEFLEALTLST